MKVQIITQEDLNNGCENVVGMVLTASPVEYMLLNSALNDFIRNKDNNEEDRKIARRIKGDMICYDIVKF